MEARAAAEQAARAAYGRLLAYLATRSRDVATAEDALGDALRAALETWPERGVPRQPEAWLLTTARRRLLDANRHASVRAAAAATLALAPEAAELAGDGGLPDDRLRLLLVCAHPAIDTAARTPLMLQVVLGLDAARIASAFLTAPSAMSQRLVRAKTKIRDAGLRFEVPSVADLPARLEAVMEAVYAAFGSGWDDVAGADARRRGLGEEAIWLARLLVALLPDEAEPKGLLALMLHSEARRRTRRTAAGAYVPLQAQDWRLWSRAMVDEAERLIREAAALGRPGRFQFEAALQSLHVEGAITGRTNWPAAVLIYKALLRLSPTVGARVGQAAAVAEAEGAEAGLRLLESHPAEGYQPYWALAAHLNAGLDRRDAATLAYARAAGLSEDPAVRTFLQTRAAALP